MPKKYTPEDLGQAKSDLACGRMTIYKANQIYGIPRSTLTDSVNNRYAGHKSGPRTVLSADEEDLIENWVLEIAARGFPTTMEQLLTSIKLYMALQKRTTSFTDNKPGRKWYMGFLKRHPVISK